VSNELNLEFFEFCREHRWPGVNLLEEWAPIEGEHPAISEPVIGQIPRAQRYSVLQSERGKRLEVGGGRQNVKCQMSKFKCQKEMSWLVELV
jgi:hypothetical protein